MTGKLRDLFDSDKYGKKKKANHHLESTVNMVDSHHHDQTGSGKSGTTILVRKPVQRIREANDES